MLPPLEYARARRPHPGTGPHQPVWSLLYMAAGVAGIGIVLAIAFRVTSYRPLAGAGFAWLVYGGIFTLVLAAVALIDMIIACFNPVDRLPNILRTAAIFLGTLLNLPFAYVCFWIAST